MEYSDRLPYTYISTFIPGFENIIEKAIADRIGPIQVIRKSSGMIVFTYGGLVQKVIDMDVVNNTFICLEEFHDPSSFTQMVNQVAKRRMRYPKQVMRTRPSNSFRIRYSYANQFQKVDSGTMKRAENLIIKELHLKPNRLNSDLEFWYIIRKEKIGFYALLLTNKAASVKKEERKGKLTAGFATLMVEWAQIPDHKAVMDPFVGYGGLANQILRISRPDILYLFDIEAEKIKELRRQLPERKNIVLKQQDARKLTILPPESIDAVITDPPWGLYERIDDIDEFYRSVLNEILRVLKIDGKLVLLLSQNMKELPHLPTLALTDKASVLVNGKKAILCSYKKIGQAGL